MYGLIGSFEAKPGERDRLIEVIIGGSGDMPGCLSYVVAKDASDENTIWVTEVWTDEQSHRASLGLPAVQAAIAKARPLVAGMKPGVTTEPVGVWAAPQR